MGHNGKKQNRWGPRLVHHHQPPTHTSNQIPPHYHASTTSSQGLRDPLKNRTNTNNNTSNNNTNNSMRRALPSTKHHFGQQKPRKPFSSSENHHRNNNNNNNSNNKLGPSKHNHNKGRHYGKSQDNNKQSNQNRNKIGGQHVVSGHNNNQINNNRNNIGGRENVVVTGHQYKLISGLSLERCKEISRIANKEGSRLCEILVEKDCSKYSIVHAEENGSGNGGGAHQLVLYTDNPLRDSEHRMLKRIFQTKHRVIGFDEWLGGAKGWRYEKDDEFQLKWKTDFKIVLNSLQKVFKLFAPKEQLYLPGTGTNEMTWKKQETLMACVSDIRRWLKIVPHDNPNNNNNNNAAGVVVGALLRSSYLGPDAPVNWSHHHPQSQRYPLSVVTINLMKELVDGIIMIFRSQFIQDDQTSSSSGSNNKALGTRWREMENHQTKFEKTTCIVWNESVLESHLNGNSRLLSSRTRGE